MTNLRCLWLTRRFPCPANSGDYLYTRGMTESLAAAAAEVTGLCWAREEEEAEASTGGVHWITVPGLSRSRLRCRLHSVPHHLPADAFRHGRPPIRKRLRQLLRKAHWDAVIIDHAAMGWALGDIRKLHPSATIIYVSHNAEAQTRPRVAAALDCSPLLRPVLRWDAMKYAALEQRLCRSAAIVSAITPKDAAFYREFAPETRIVTNLPGYDGPRFPDRRIEASLPRRVVLSGSFQWIAKQHNLVRFLETVDPIFAEAGVELQIVGKASDSFVREILDRFPRCRFDANVPDISPYLAGARIGVIPEELGGGFKLKSLDYVFHGLPLAILEGAAAGLPINYRRDVISGSSLKGLAVRMIAHIDDHEYLDRLRATVYAKCDPVFCWDGRGAGFLGEIRKAAAQNGGTPITSNQPGRLVEAGKNQEA